MKKKAAWVSKNVSYSSNLVKCKSQSFASETKQAGELVTIFFKTAKYVGSEGQVKEKKYNSLNGGIPDVQ